MTCINPSFRLSERISGWLPPWLFLRPKPLIGIIFLNGNVDLTYSIKIAGLYDGCAEVAEYLELRKSLFVDKLSWSIPSWKGYEFDQYDTAKTVYVLAKKCGKVVAGGRLIRTDSKMPNAGGSAQYTYMIADAYSGLLEGMPPELCRDDPPRDAGIWEFSRIVSSNNDGEAVRAVFDAVDAFIAGQGGAGGVFIGSPALMRLCRMCGFEPEPMGPIVRTPDAGRFLAFACGVKGNA